MVKNCDLGHSFSPYGPPSRQITYIYVDKISLNYGAETNLSFTIAYEIPRLNLNEFNRKYPGRLQKQTLKT